MQKREALKKRTTMETDIEIFIRLDGQQQITLDIPVPFFPHLLKSLAFYANWDLTVKARGDVEMIITILLKILVLSLVKHFGLLLVK